MIPIPVPDEAKAGRPDCTVVNMGPPRGVSDDDCGTAQMLIGGAPLAGFGGRGQYAYFRPSPEELEQLQAGGFIEMCQAGNVVQPFSLAVWPAEPPREGGADDDVPELGETGSDSTASQSRDGADSHDVGPDTSTRATPAVEEGDPDGGSVPVAPQGSRLTTDRADPRLGHGVDDAPGPQNDAYLVLSDAERAKGFVRPVRRRYIHTTCGTVTTMGQAIAETYARDPKFYGATFCVNCSMHRPVGENGEFVWDDGSGQKVGT